MLSVLSYNIFFGKRADEIISWVAVLPKQFDILCFQEFPKEKIPFLKKVLRPAAYAYASNVIYKGKDYGQLTVVMNQKIALVDEAEIKLGSNMVEDKILQLKGERSSLLTTLRYNNKQFLLANTHLIAFALNALRRKQLSIVIEYIAGVSQKKKNMPTVVLGDFNYSSLFGRQKFFAYMKQNRFINAHTEMTHNLLFLTYHQLDYIFYKYCKVKKVQILKQRFSDHLPMSFDIVI